MSDVYDKAKRSAVMARVRSRDTGPELRLRRLLTGLGARYRLHRQDLPGSPDVVMPGRRLAIFVHGCFWHGHDCPLFRLPATRPEFWATKILGNRERDRCTAQALRATGWRMLTVWECSLKGPARQPLAEIMDHCVGFIRGEAQEVALAGMWPA